MVLCWCTRVRPRTRRKRKCKIPLTPAGRGRVRKMGVSWWFSGPYPRASPHAENEEVENSIHARGTRAGTKAVVLLADV